jgi:DNA-binding NtrC family response regulator
MALFRAVEVAYQSGALNDAGIAALAAIEELGEHLTPDELRAVYERADAWLETSQHLPTLHRLRQAAIHVLGAGRKREDAPEVDAEKESALRELMMRYEKKLIRQALQRACGSITQAARLLGITHQALNYMLQHRHRDLLIERTPVVPRKRSIIKKNT